MQLFNISNILKTRVLRQWLLASIVLITIGLGWKYYWITFVVPVVMLINMLSPLLKKGRIVCGNFCPRGAFYDRILRLFSRRKKIPAFFRSKKFRWSFLIILFGSFIIRAIYSPFTAEHFGQMFWLMCTVTTGIGVLLGIFFSHRTWCAFCPIGTFISAMGKDTHRLTIDKNLCVSCKLCEKSCPLNIRITKDKNSGKLSDNDCLKCGECLTTCPKKALQFRASATNKSNKKGNK